MIYDGAVSVQGGTGWYSMILGQWKAVVVGTWWYLVIIGWYWLKHYGTGSVKDGTGKNLVVLSQYGVEGGTGRCLMVLVSRRHYWLLLGCTGSLWGGTGWFLVILG